MIYEILEQVRGTSSKNEKQEILTKHKDNELLRSYLYLTYSPHLNFYMKKLPKASIGEGGFAHFSVLFEGAAWSLSKRAVTGNAAQDYVKRLMMELDEKHQQLLSWMLLKDVKAGFNVSTINKVWPDLIFEPPYMRCSLESDVNFDKWDWLDGEHCVQLKADGMFVNVIVTTDGPQFMSRQGSIFPDNVLGEVQEQALYLSVDAVYMGELTVHETATGRLLARTIGNGILNSALQGALVGPEYEVRVDFWDAVHYDKWKEGYEELPYWLRLEDLVADVEYAKENGANLISVIETREIGSLEEAKEIADEWMKLGLEGAVLKHGMMPWKDHTSKLQVKLKKEVCVELLAIELVAGKATGKNADLFGSIRCQSEDGLLVVDIPGFSDEMRYHIFHHWDDQYVNRVMTVKANDLLMPGKNNDKYSLFLPRFIEWRMDKYEADTLEMIESQFKNSGE